MKVGVFFFVVGWRFFCFLFDGGADVFVFFVVGVGVFFWEEAFFF